MKTKKVEFLTFSRFTLYVIFQWNFPGVWVNFLVLLSHIPYKKSELPLACSVEVFTGLRLSTPTFCKKDYDYVKHFVCVLVLLVINTGCLDKVWNITLLISSSVYAQCHINVCSGGNLCSLFLTIFLNRPCIKVGFDVRISLV